MHPFQVLRVNLVKTEGLLKVSVNGRNCKRQHSCPGTRNLNTREELALESEIPGFLSWGQHFELLGPEQMTWIH